MKYIIIDELDILDNVYKYSTYFALIYNVTENLMKKLSKNYNTPNIKQHHDVYYEEPYSTNNLLVFGSGYKIEKFEYPVRNYKNDYDIIDIIIMDL